MDGRPPNAEQSSGPTFVPSENEEKSKIRKMMDDLQAWEHATNLKTLALARKVEEECRNTMRQQMKEIAERANEKRSRKVAAYNEARLAKESQKKEEEEEVIISAEDFNKKEALILQKLLSKAKELQEKK